MAAYLLMVSALITASAAAADAKTDEALFEASASCVAYHVFATSQMDPVSEEAKLSEEKATTFLLAAYSKDAAMNPDAVEARIESIVEGLIDDRVTVEPVQHAKEIAELKQVCSEFEPAALAIVEAAGLNSDAK
ncbi:MAG: hypothetical protein IPH79_06310 [Sphingomonadales bacterium]|nr:hypothetical protein [Sphingomonadales bacterium]